MKSKMQTAIKFTVTMKLDEEEARALEAIACYGVDAFLKTFYERMGKHYLQPHEKGIKSLFLSIGENVSPALRTIHKARIGIQKALKGD